MRSSQVDVGPWMHGAAGILGGATSTFLFYPLDVMRARLQAQDGTEGRRLACLREVVQSNGVSAMYRGVNSAVAAHSVGWGMYLVVFRSAQGLYGKETVSSDFMAAVTASTITATMTNPLFVLKTRRQLHEGEQAGKITLRSIAQTEGVRGWFRGLAPQILISSHTAIQITLYEMFKRRRNQGGAHSQPSLPDVMLSAALSKVVAAVLTNPIDVVRTRLQDHRNNSKNVEVRYTTIPQAFKTIVQREGVRGLYQGMGINVIRVVPSTMVGFVAYEYCLSIQRSWSSSLSNVMA